MKVCGEVDETKARRMSGQAGEANFSGSAAPVFDDGTETLDWTLW
jgi:hypothetical protein